MDITCANDGGNKKLMFKYSGTRRLTDQGSVLVKLMFSFNNYIFNTNR